MKFIFDEKTYMICSRINPSGKPVLFLLRLDGTKRTYISSLYPTDKPNIHGLEYQGKRYLLDRDKCIIVPMCKYNNTHRSYLTGTQ